MSKDNIKWSNLNRKLSGSDLSAYDLKKGNIFYDKKAKSIFEINTFNNHGIRVRYPWGGSIFLDLQFVEPLKVNDELLLKMGFEKDLLDHIESTFGFTKKIKGKYKDYEEDLVIEYSFEYQYYFIDSIDFNFKYVHELQNLYHLLTGTMMVLADH